MSDAEKVEFILKVVENKQKNLLFLEGGSDFADVLLSFLTLPLGTIVRVLKKHYGDEAEAPAVGSLTTLYNGLENLDSDHFWTEGCKTMLLNPTSLFAAEYRKLKIDISGTQVPTKYFCCEDFNCAYPRRSNISMHYDTPTCRCRKRLKRELAIRHSCGYGGGGGGGGSRGGGGGGGIFTLKKASFLMSGDMRVVPNVAGSVMETVGNLGITDTYGAEPRNVTCGLNYIMILLKLLLRPQKNSAATKTEPGILFHEKEKSATWNSKKMVLKVRVQKSTNKLLFAQSEEDFVDFLFSLLIIPLGRVVFLLGGDTSLTRLDNLYRSLENINGDKYLKIPATKSRLINPKIPYGYMPVNQILPMITEKIAPRLYYNLEILDLSLGEEWLSCTGHGHAIELRNGQGSYIKEGTTMYMVTDDLTVTPLSVTSALSMLNKLKIPLSDVKEVEMQIGLQEALSILKASLSSTSALTNGLMMNPVFNKQP